jgi:hypothetical protein
MVHSCNNNEIGQFRFISAGVTGLVLFHPVDAISVLNQKSKVYNYSNV